MDVAECADTAGLGAGDGKGHNEITFRIQGLKDDETMDSLRRGLGDGAAAGGVWRHK